MSYRDRSSFLDLGRSFVINTVIGLLLTGLGGVAGDVRSWRSFFELLLANQIYAQIIGFSAAILIPPIAGRIYGMPSWRKWPAYILALCLVALFGTFIANSLGTVLGIFPAKYFWPRMRGAVSFSVLITLIIGVAIYFIESLRYRAEQTTLALRTKELEAERIRKLAAEAQLNSLQSRLQPHFLFNTINSILSLIREDPERAEAMLQRLSRLLRFALDTQQRSVVPLDAEIKLVSDYMEIEKMRFGARLRFSLDVPSDLLALEVPPYSLQTLVENSMKYAVATRREGGTVHVSAQRDNGSLILEVRDDGPGFSISDLRAGHGLDTLQSRLHALYGSNGVLDVPAGEGAVVRVKMPAGLSS